MRDITVEDAPLIVDSGLVQLNEDQARRRAHLIAPVKGKDGVFEIKSPIQFKVGETFGFDGDDKSLPIQYRPAREEPAKAAKSAAPGKTGGKAPVSAKAAT